MAYGFTDITDPMVEHGSLFMDPLFDTTSRDQALIAQAAHNTLTGRFC